MGPAQQAELLAVARDIEAFGLKRSAGRIRAALDWPAADERPCSVQDRSPGGIAAIPWGLAEILYPAYGHDQTLERLHERGGFGRIELGMLAVDAYGWSPGQRDDRRGRLKRWPILDLYDLAVKA